MTISFDPGRREVPLPGALVPRFLDSLFTTSLPADVLHASVDGFLPLSLSPAFCGSGTFLSTTQT